MQYYIVKGGNKLEGEVFSSGSKNASLPILAASILNEGKTYLKNVPNIHDTKIMYQIMELLGVKIYQEEEYIVIDSTNIYSCEIPDNLMRQMRSSVILAGAIIGRCKKAKFSYPGGCDIGIRPIDLHLTAFKKMGINILEEEGVITCYADKIIGNTITLDFPSVGATENIILAATLSEGTTYIKNAAMEPEIVDLQNFINRMGGNVVGAGTKEIKIRGVNNLKSTRYEIMPDRIEIGTLLCATAITKGNVIVKNVMIEHLIPMIYKLEEIGCEIELKNKKIQLKAKDRLNSCNIKTMPYPGFPTDMQPIIASVLGTSKGTSIIIENIFENRFKYLAELKRMGAKVTIEGKTAIIKGIRRYNATSVEATDLRGGAALLIAGLNASGTTEISNIKYILRGYENIDKKLNALGANINIREGE